MPASRAFLRRLFDAALAAVDPMKCVPPHLPDPATVKGRIVVIGAGKAAAAMAAAVEAAWAEHLDRLSGLVVTRYGHGVPTQKIEVVEAGHPVPDEAGLTAARRILAMVQGLEENDLVLALMSGGGSALLTLPAPGVSLAEKQARTRELLRSGASIHEINAERKRLSAIKGGKLAAAAMPARVLTLAISDVPGDDPAVIASGPTVPAPNEPAYARCETRVIATALDALNAAADAARAAGVRPLILGDRIEGEAREAAKVMAGIARSCKAHGLPVRPPCVILSGGETTVTVKGQGRGGRNTEFLLALALALAGEPGISAIACDTDGIDGTEDNAGALIDAETLRRAGTMDARAKLMDNDAYGFFAALGDLVVTGPTRSNVNDFRAILVEP
ncbi:MAG: glycerate kinase [Rhodocyclaceae bacterium]|nr:glycerate kinase [Rhodocyclaceae bacterium]